MRQRLDVKLKETLKRKLTVIAAPAGYGKTTLASEWIAHHRISAAWLSLEKGDDVHFWSYLVQAIGAIARPIADELLPVLDSYRSASMEFALSYLIEELGAISHDIVLVLDDYHLIADQDIHSGLQFLLTHLPARVHLMIIGRSAPPISLARLRTLGQLCEINMHDLSFSPEETAELFDYSFNLSLQPSDLAILHAKTEGWAAGLKLASFYMRIKEDDSLFIRDFSGNHRFIVDYMIDEVLSRQSEEVQNFLLHTSILDRFCAPLCCALTDNEAASEILAYLEKMNLFIVPLDDDRTWYRYHHLFAELLQKLLIQRVHPRQLTEARMRVSAWFAEQGQYKEAIPHAIAAGRAELAVHYMNLMLEPAEASMEDPVLTGWMEQIPVRNLLLQPKVLIYFIGTLSLSMTGKQAEAWKVMDEAESILTNEPHLLSAEARELVTMNLSVFRGVIEIASNPSRLIEHLDTVVALIEANGKQTHFLNNAYEMSLIRGPLGLGGKIGSSLAVHQKITEDKQRAQFFYEHFDGHGHLFAAELYYETNELSFVRSELERGMLYAEAAIHTALIAPGYYLQSRLKQAEGDSDGAAATLREAIALLARMRTPRWGGLLEAAYIRLELMQGNKLAGTQWVQRRLLRTTAKPDVTNEFENITFARVLMAQNHTKDAIKWLLKLLNLADINHRYASTIEIKLLLALCRMRQGDSESAMRLLESALSRGESEGLVRIFLDEGQEMVRLLSYWLRSRPPHGSVIVEYANKLLTLFRHGEDRMQRPRLTNREQEILFMISSGQTNQQIASDLQLAIGTIRRYIHNLFEKLEAKNRIQALSRAKELGFL